MILLKGVFMKIRFGLLLLLPCLSAAQHMLTVKVEGLKSSEGLVAVAVYNTSSAFLKDGKAFTGAFETTKKGTTMISIPNLPKGTYAVSIFHDENGNKQLDTNFVGIPKEPVAFSKAQMKMFGPPGFEECAFEIKGDIEISIPIK
jgi:uncharacterized protein (DUF2141 family)